MSYLLDSLKKSEKERRENNTGADYVLRSPAFLANEVPKSRYKLWLVVIVVLLLCLVVYGVFKIFTLNEATDQILAQQNLPGSILPNSQNTSSDKETLLAKENAIALYQQTRGQSSSTDIDSLYEEVNYSNTAQALSRGSSSERSDNKLEAIETQDATNSTIQKAINEATRDLSTGEAASLVSNVDTVEESTINTDARSEDLLSNQPESDDEQISDSNNAIPSIYDIDSYTRKEIPNIDYGAHIYATDNNSGFVILDGARRRSGDRLESGLYVEKIEEERVILNFNGVLFALPAMKSWVGK